MPYANKILTEEINNYGRMIMKKLYYMDTIEYKSRSVKAIFLLADMELFINHNIAIFGTGIEAYLVFLYLKQRGIKVNYFINNDKNMSGRMFCETKILNLPDIDIKEYYVVIAMNSREYNNEVIWQLKVHQQNNYALVFTELFHCFSKNLQDIVMKEINFIAGIDNNVISPVNNVNSTSLYNMFGKIPELCMTTTWSHCLLEWFNEEYSLKKFSDKLCMLEIGPGCGLFSSVVHVLNPNIDIKWLMFETEECSEKEVYDKYTYYPAKLFGTYYGMIENPEYQIKEKFNIIVMTEVMEHFVTNPIPTLRKIAGMLKKGGKIFLSTPNWRHLRIYDKIEDLPEFTEISENYNDWYKGHTYQYSRVELEEVFEKSGLVVERYAISDSCNHNIILSCR